MGELRDALEKLFSVVINLNTQQIALISIIVSFILYVMGKHSELKFKKYEAKKENYYKLIDIFSKIFQSVNLEEVSQEDKEKFFDLGSSLAIYGSKKLYKSYVFFRNLDSNEFVKKSNYYDNGLLIYIMADMFKQIRKEVGLNNSSNISYNDMLAFFINDIGNNPYAKKKGYDAIYRIKMLKLELFFVDISTFVHTFKLYNSLIRPIGGFIKIFLWWMVVRPVVHFTLFLFPKLSDKLSKFDMKK